ncbi:autotransporter-associated beta strand repeat-containing protein, partial [Polynucleobacter sp. AP-Latsch-80-C2]|uniref:autotransporter-associated beta strand repeat-containing protein n=1 Tax=Polynucleobacter sp. AP-Latsch-80-C2 TaxID=2576931 RepID=UPI001C0D4328
AGTVILGNATTNSTYSGGTTVNGGTLKAGSSFQPFGTGAVTETSSGGVVINLNGQTITNALTLYGDGISSTGALINGNSGATGSVSGDITLGSAVTINATNGITSTGRVTGAFGLTEIGSGTLTLGNATTNSTYSGGTTVNGGTLKAGSSFQPFGTGAVTEITTGEVVIDLNGKTISNALTLYSAATPTVYALTSGVTGGIQQTGTVTLGSNVLLGLTTGKTMTINGVIADTNAYTLTVNKIGDTGTVIFGGANTYTGATTVNAGTLQVSGSGTVGNTSSLLTLSSATLDLRNGLTIGS